MCTSIISYTLLPFYFTFYHLSVPSWSGSLIIDTTVCTGTIWRFRLVCQLFLPVHSSVYSTHIPVPWIKWLYHLGAHLCAHTVSPVMVVAWLPNIQGPKYPGYYGPDVIISRVIVMFLYHWSCGIAIAWMEACHWTFGTRGSLPHRDVVFLQMMERGEDGHILNASISSLFHLPTCLAHIRQHTPLIDRWYTQAALLAEIV